MARVKGARFCEPFSLLCFNLFLLCSSGYQIPDVQIQALRPKGLRVSLPDAPNMGLFVFQGNVNRPIADTDTGSYTGEVTSPTNGRWVYEDLNAQLKVGDVINYYVYVAVNNNGYIKDKLSFTVRALEDSSDLPPTVITSPPTSPTLTSTLRPISGECRPTSTVIRGGSACSGQVIFEDNFDTLKESVWQIEQYIPSEHPEFPFISYQRSAVSVSDGILRIRAKPQQNLPGFNNDSIVSGDLNIFSGCTGSASECSVSASGASILPPIASGRITSKGLAFTYGTVFIRAKLPQGDWLYPEILLEPFRKKYGNMFASGMLNIARARGNKELYYGITTRGNKVLYGGPIMDVDCRQYLITERIKSDSQWGDDFHIFSVNWTPDRITLSVDGQEWARIEPAANGLQGMFPPTCRDLPRQILSAGSKMAPFDDHFYITLGMAAGGITEFPDDLYTQNFKPKPWRNKARKAVLNFWQDLDSWLPTWNHPELLVDYVKVVAL